LSFAVVGEMRFHIASPGRLLTPPPPCWAHSSHNITYVPIVSGVVFFLYYLCINDFFILPGIGNELFEC
jgi:hypothetical protein